jgi:hypothetical protein
VLHLSVASFLWRRAAWIATKIAPDEDHAARWPMCRVTDLQIAAFSALGVLSLIYSAAWFSYSLGGYLNNLNSPLSTRGGSLATWLTSEGFLAALTYAILGLMLVVGSRNIVRFVRRLRLPRFEDPDAE